MMMPTEGPKTSLMEDLQDLGLVEGNITAKSNETLGRKSDAQGGDYAGPDDGSQGPYDEAGYMKSVGDGPAGSRKEVQVRSDGNFKKDAKEAEYDEYDDEDVVFETESTNRKMVPAFLIPSDQEVQEAEERAEVDTEADRLNRAWEVVNTYFSEDEDGLNEDGLRGVINAMGYALNIAVEDIANLTVENERVIEAVNELTGLLQEAENALYEGGHNGMDYPDDDDDDDDKKDDDDDDKKGYDSYDDDEDESKKKMPPWLQKKDESRRYRGRVLTEDCELTSLASELRYIGESRTTRAIDVQSELIEGYESILDTCSDVVARIIDVITEDADLEEGEELEFYEDDERVQVARFFESIADDATRYLSRLADGDVPFRIAQADLGKLYGDMEKGIETMHTVE